MSKTMVTALALLFAPLATTVTTDAQAANLRDSSGAYELQVLVDGSPASTYQQNGETYVLGHRGARYTLRVQNHSGRRIEAVVSVDGRDVIDGRGADYAHKRGYLVPAYGSVDIDGWRLSGNQAAAFRFSSVAGSYAARTGSAREVGVVGVAVFPERESPPYHVLVPRPHPRPYYNYRGRDDIYGSGPGDEERAAPSAKAERSSEDYRAPATSAPPAPPSDRAGGAMAQREKAPSQRPGLGTGFGERIDSAVQEVPFARQNPSSPSALLGVRYNDRQGLLAMGIDVDGDGYYSDGENYRRRTANPFPSNSPRYATPPPGWEGGYGY